MSANKTAPSVLTLSVSKSNGMAVSTQSSRSLCGAIPVRSQEWFERLQQLIRCLLGDPVSAGGNDRAFDIVSNQPHGVGHAFAEGFASADSEYRQRQLALLPLFVLRDRNVDRSIRGKTAAERVSARCQ